MVANLLLLSTLVLFPALMAFSASADLFTMTFPNRICVGLVAAYLALAIAIGLPLASVALDFTCGLAVLVIAFIFFSKGWIGGGDAKLAAATALWLGWALVLDYGLLSSILGGILTLILIAGRRAPLPPWAARFGWRPPPHPPNSGVPYGSALAPARPALHP